MNHAADPTYYSDFLKKRNIYYTGTASILRFNNNKKQDVIKWVNKPCFAAWRGIPHGTITELSYNPRIRELTIPREATKVFKGGWELVRSVFRTLPSYRSLRAGAILRVKPEEWPLWEINVIWRAVRAFQEHPAFLTSCYWSQMLYPHLPPEIHMAVSSSYQIGPEGYLRPQWGGPHLSFSSNGGELAPMLGHVRAFAYMRHNEGRLTGRGSFRRTPTGQDDRDFMGRGINNMMCGKEGYFKAVEEMADLRIREVIDTWGDTPDALDLLMCVLARVHRRASTVAPATPVSITCADIPMFSTVIESTRRRDRPW